MYLAEYDEMYTFTILVHMCMYLREITPKYNRNADFSLILTNS